MHRPVERTKLMFLSIRNRILTRMLPQVLGAALLVTAGSEALAQETVKPQDEPQGTYQSAPVVIDGNKLFDVYGVRSFPAQLRAQQTRKNIIEAARDASVTPADINVTEAEGRSTVSAGQHFLINVFDVDGELEGVDRRLLAGIFQNKIAASVTKYRSDRSAPVLLRNTGYALGATLLMAVLLWGILWLMRWLDAWARRHIHKNLEGLADKSHQLIRSSQLWMVFGGVLRGFRYLALGLLFYFYLNGVLGLYPWTRPAAVVLFDLIIDPLESLWRGFLASVPNLVFLFILFLVVRYILRLARLFFNGVEAGRIKLNKFDPDWAQPTYKILRVFILAFAVVVAYPYIPGSSSLAFKGVSLFLGVILSLGSSSFIANLLAGLSMTYRGGFKEGDRVRIGEVFGKVQEIKLMITRIRTYKNEIVVIPNSTILNTNVINYSALAREQGLVLHTTVGIGYDAPWRQVEAMLKIAAERTEGLKKDPPPFVLQTSLGDYAVNYELNVYCADASGMPAKYSELHRNIQDVFNEHGVQIMSPAYIADPAEPKVVPPEGWYANPATPPGINPGSTRKPAG